jgi:hypothetical protein
MVGGKLRVALTLSSINILIEATKEIFVTVLEKFEHSVRWPFGGCTS